MNHKKSWYPKKGRVILHADMNSFYASVETADDPQLRGKPLAIAGNPDERKGIIVTCNYEARAYGIKTTMALWQAKKLCKDLIVKRIGIERFLGRFLLFLRSSLPLLNQYRSMRDI